jgi:hypothetical protein
MTLSVMTAPDDRMLMKPLPCSPANSILESDLELSVQQQTLDKMKVMETPEGFYVTVKLLWAADKEWYLTTRRNRSEPRVFKDLRRLNDHLKAAYPSDGFELIRNQELPSKEGCPPPHTAKTK